MKNTVESFVNYGDANTHIFVSKIQFQNKTRKICRKNPVFLAKIEKIKEKLFSGNFAMEICMQIYFESLFRVNFI